MRTQLCIADQRVKDLEETVSHSLGMGHFSAGSLMEYFVEGNLLRTPYFFRHLYIFFIHFLHPLDLN